MTDSLASTTSTKVQLKDCCEEIAQRIDNPAESGFERFVGLEHLETGETSIRNWGSTEDVTSSMKLFKAGDVIVARRNVYLRRASRAHFDGLCSGDGIVLRSKPGICLPDLLPFLLNTDAFWEYVTSQADGTMSKRITVKRLLSYEFALPPLEEQRRIAEVLQAANSYSGSLDSMCEAAEQAHRALRLRLFRLDASPRWDRSGKLPEGWNKTAIGEVAEFLDGKRVPLKSADRAQRQGPYPYYGASGVIDHIDDYIFDEDLLLVSEDGANLIDRTTPIAFEVSGKIWVNNHAHVLRAKPPFSNFVISEYIESLNVEPFVTGSAQPKINKAACESIPIPLPPTDVLADIEQKLRGSVAVLKACRERGSASKEVTQAALRELLITKGAEL
jgi:type I restriction enzyme S subunit